MGYGIPEFHAVCFGHERTLPGAIAVTARLIVNNELSADLMAFLRAREIFIFPLHVDIYSILAETKYFDVNKFCLAS